MARIQGAAAMALPLWNAAEPGCRSRGDPELWLTPLPVHVVTVPSQLPESFLQPDPKKPLTLGFDCEGVDLARHGRLCIMQLAFEDAVYLVDAVVGGKILMQACKPALESPHVTKVVHDCKRDGEALYFQHGIKLNNVFDTQIGYSLIEQQQGKQWIPDDYISFVDLLADERFCGVVYGEKNEVRSLLRKDPSFWMRRPLTEMMTRVAADDVRFLLRIHHNMVQRMGESVTWQLSVRGLLSCRCFCVDAEKDGDGDGDGDGGGGEGGGEGEGDRWPPLPCVPDDLEEEVLAVVDVPKGMMGRVIGKKGASIVSIKESCRANIFIGGAKGPPDKVFVIGPVKEVRKAEAIVRGKML